MYRRSLARLGVSGCGSTATSCVVVSSSSSPLFNPASICQSVVSTTTPVNQLPSSPSSSFSSFLRRTSVLLQGAIHNPVSQQKTASLEGSLDDLPEANRRLSPETLKSLQTHKITVPAVVLDARLVSSSTAAAAVAAEVDAADGSGGGGGADAELVSTVKIPAIVWEYLYQLGEARIVHQKRIEGLMAAANGGLVVDTLRNLSGSQFDFGLWTKRFAQDIEVADEAYKHLTQIRDAHQLISDQRAASANSSDAAVKEEADMMIEMAQEDVTSALRALLGSVEDGGTSLLTSIVELLIRRADEAEGAMAKSTVWTMETLGRAGGTEAGIFACDLIEFYKAYGAWKGWKVEDITEPGYTHGGKLRIEGEGVLQVLKHEMGTHRVQRVPTTESEGRMQTSTASVFVLPQPTTASVDIKESDCVFDFVRGSGPGGQGMQSSSNACVLTHKPSNLTFKVHQARSALGNRELALEMLAQKLWQEKNKVNVQYQNSLFAKQWTSGERGEKIRTYNYQQNRVTDHRIGADFGLISYMEGASMAGSMHAQLMAQDRSIGIFTVLSKLLIEGLSSDEPPE